MSYVTYSEKTFIFEVKLKKKLIQKNIKWFLICLVVSKIRLKLLKWCISIEISKETMRKKFWNVDVAKHAKVKKLVCSLITTIIQKK